MNSLNDMTANLALESIVHFFSKNNPTFITNFTKPLKSAHDPHIEASKFKTVRVEHPFWGTASPRWGKRVPKYVPIELKCILRRLLPLPRLSEIPQDGFAVPRNVDKHRHFTFPSYIPFERQPPLLGINQQLARFFHISPVQRA
ncbi:hypothetical protein Zmor_004599 [Zophobas morio]|uniref:Uncharacterized protein n=1 Tax=Zophobas morio TaxID=2755281 RepID=A0AA38ML53_9CUCU|nr:hypothetical protein Zmor_004599 [Zophobas morio]